MKLLILTQKVDQNDPVLGFFHRWLIEFSKHYEQVSVICLGKGSYSLPSNVKVYSLGKEEGRSKLTNLWRFYKYIWGLRHEYDAVFVHMNQEYVILGWKSWFLFSKPVYLWRNHFVGGLLTRLAVFLSHKVFYTSPQSFIARFKKAEKMPVGIDTDFFKSDPQTTRPTHSILFLGRISPVKHVLEFVEWFNTLDASYTATVAGGPLPKDEAYFRQVKGKASDRIKFIGAVTQAEALKLYQSHEIYVNKTPAGSFDKAIFEAAACGMKLMVDNPDAQNINVSEHSLKLLMAKLTQEIV
jgi:glycosyltransferase involved in cell wall biosynthesis